LKEIKLALQKVSGFSSDYSSLFERVNSLAIELDDIVDDLNKATDSLSNDPEQLELVSQKLQMLYNLQKSIRY